MAEKLSSLEGTVAPIEAGSASNAVFKPKFHFYPHGMNILLTADTMMLCGVIPFVLIAGCFAAFEPPWPWVAAVVALNLLLLISRIRMKPVRYLAEMENELIYTRTNLGYESVSESIPYDKIIICKVKETQTRYGKVFHLHIKTGDGRIFNFHPEFFRDKADFDAFCRSMTTRTASLCAQHQARISARKR